MSRTRSGLLVAGLLSTALLAPSSSQARTVTPTSKALCGHPTCTTAQLRARVVEIRHKVVRLRDRRGLLKVRLRGARLTHNHVQLNHEGTYWRVTWHRIKDRRPLWRTLRRWDAWMCIHGHEGAWTDPNAPYHGGLQMDAGFMRTYGSDLLRRYGTADHWPPAAQVAVAERAYRTRGFYPWPNTARACGVL